MSKAPPPVTLDFEDAGFEGPEWDKHDLLSEQLSTILTLADARANALEASRLATSEAVDKALEDALYGVEMLFIERDPHSILPSSIDNASWEVEEAPVPPTMDSWLRAAIPETVTSRTSFAMYQVPVHSF